MKHLLLTSSAIAMILTAPAMAQSLSDRLVADYQAQGYSYIEIYQGPTQIKVEATKGNQTLEVIYDAASGAILYRDVDPADADEMNRQGVEFNRESRDFSDDEDDDSRDDDDDSDDDDDHSSDDDDHDDDHGSDDDDDGDDDDNDDD